MEQQGGQHAYIICLSKTKNQKNKRTGGPIVLAMDLGKHFVYATIDEEKETAQINPTEPNYTYIAHIHARHLRFFIFIVVFFPDGFKLKFEPGTFPVGTFRCGIHLDMAHKLCRLIPWVRPPLA